MSNKKISNEEKQLFQEAVLGVKPLHPKKAQSTKIEPEKQTLTKPIPKITIKKIIPQQPSLPVIETQAAVSGNDTITFSKTGLQHKRFTKLKQGKIKAQATLDLHEHTSDEALIAVDQFIERARQQSIPAVCIIHGKGQYSQNNTPVLKNLLNNYLRHHPGVLAFHSAKKEAGGTGAIYVLLKSK